MQNEEMAEEKGFLFRTIAIMASVLVVIVSTTCVIFRVMNNRHQREKWKDYDECGLS